MTRMMHRWTDAQVAYVLDNASTPGPELIAGFREKFGVSEDDLTDTAIRGKRYGLLHHDTQSPERRVAGLRSKVEAAEQALEDARKELADAEAKLAEQQTEALAVDVGDLEAMTKAQLVETAENGGLDVRKSWNKGRIIQAIQKVA